VWQAGFWIEKDPDDHLDQNAGVKRLDRGGDGTNWRNGVKIGGTDAQASPRWVRRFNTVGPDGLVGWR
jgi:hypothetical protein